MISKKNIEALAVFGGPPLCEQPLHVGRPNVGDRDALLRRINDSLDRDWLSNGGPLVRQFESEIAKHIDVKHCIATCNATIALELTYSSIRS